MCDYLAMAAAGRLLATKATRSGRSPRRPRRQLRCDPPCTILSGGHGTRPDLRQEKKGNPCLVVVGPAGNTMELASHEMKWMQEGGGSAGSHTSRVRHHDHRTSPLRRHRRDLLPPAGHGTRTGLFFFLKLRTGLRGRRRGKTDTVGRRWRLAVAGSR
jgi:hypothetical protein